MPTELWKYTEAQAEAMSAAEAAKVLARQEEAEEEGYGEAWDRELAGYALEYEDENHTPRGSALPDRGPDGKFVVRKYDKWADVPEAPELWRHWSEIITDEKEMLKLEVGEALSLHPKVKEILERKAEAPMKAFNEKAKPETKKKYEDASDANKKVILASWLEKHGKDLGGRRGRKTRKGRKGRKESRRTRRRV
jgi:hypothetical protein